MLILLALCIGYFVWQNVSWPLDQGSLSKQEAAAHATAYFGLDPAQVETFVTYDADEQMIGYLQKEQLLQTYSERYDPSYPLDYYKVDIAMRDEPQGVRYQALVHMQEGIVVGWSIRLPEDQYALQQIDENQARVIAEQYIREQRPNELTDADVKITLQANGIYRVYFAQSHEAIGEAFRYSIVDVAGDSVVTYYSFFSPPSSFLTWFEQQDDRSSLMTNLSLWISAAMAAAALAIAIVNRHAIRWTDGFILVGITILIEALQLMNMLPNYQSMIDYRQLGWLGFTFELMFSLSFSFVFALAVYLPYLGGKALLAQRNESHLLMPNRAADWHREWISAAVKGYGFAIMLLAVQTLIFQVAEASFHVWWIPDPTLMIDNLLWPFLMPLAAWAAAIGEEIVYRVFALSFFAKLFRSTFAGVLISSMIWGLGHTAYPVYPVYTRFIEVTLIGIIFGYIFLRFGFAVAVFAHAAVDSILMGLELTRYGVTGILAAIGYICLPLIVGYVLAAYGAFKRRHADHHPLAPPDQRPPQPHYR